MYKKPIYTLLLVVLATIILWILYITVLNFVFGDISERALFGDSFGGLNAFVSSLAFGGIIYTILLQRKDLKTQRAEINYQRKEFQINRITNIIYLEVQKYNHALEDIELKFHDSEKPTSFGEAGFREFSEKLKIELNSEYANEAGSNSAGFAKSNKTEIKRLILLNKEPINFIFNQLYNSARIINLTLKNENIDPQDKEELKTIFILNLGTSMNEIIERLDMIISDIVKEDSSLKELDLKVKYLKNFQADRNQVEVHDTVHQK